MRIVPYRRHDVVNSACAAILEVIKPGDVVNQISYHKWWQLWSAIPHCAIRLHHKRLFGGDSMWRHTHTMLYLDEDNTFSVELPRATTKPLVQYCLTDLWIYRLRLAQLTPEDIETLKAAAMGLVGPDYDIGQLLDIGVSHILGYEHQRPVTFFDFGRKKKVCSVGVRIAFEQLYMRRLKTRESKRGKWLFHDMNPEKWPEEKVLAYKGTDVEATSPGHFANSDYFCHDFELIARFKDGKRVEIG
jgi:hypothetical protein